MSETTEKISIDDFAKVEIKLGTVLEVSVVEGADKLYKLIVDFGIKRPEERDNLPDQSPDDVRGEKEIRQILSAIREYVKEEELLGKQFPFITNLAPRMIRGLESNGMILAGSDSETFTLLSPTKVLHNGTRLR